MVDEDLIRERSTEIRDSWSNLERLKSLLDAWDKDFGHKYDDLVEKLVGEQLEETWRKKAEEHGSNSLDDLLSILLDWPDAEFVKEEADGGYKVTTTHCPIAANYRAIGCEDYGSKFHCISDPYISRGFNSRIKHRKTSSRMLGDDSCVHYYTIDESK